MTAGSERERLLRALTDLYTELGYEEPLPGLEAEHSSELEEGRPLAALTTEDDEQLVIAMREALARMASAVTPQSKPAAQQNFRAVLGALNGAEMVMRSELLLGNNERIAEMVPSFAFLVALPLVGKEEAMRVSRRAAELVDGRERGRP